jgi:HSP20 family protein
MADDLIRFMNSLFLPGAHSAQGTAWEPSTDVYRTRSGWLVKLDLAGVRPEDVQVSVSGSHLSVRGLRRDWCLEEGCCQYQMEIAYSRFERHITLPVDLERAHVRAEHREGMVLIHIDTESNA